MAIQPNKPNSRVFLLLGVVLAALAFGGVLFALNQGKGGGNTVAVVVAKTDIATGTPITADLITIAQVPPAAASVDVFHDPSQLLGKTPSTSIKANTVLVPAFFTPQAVTTTSSNGTTTTNTVTSLEYNITKGFVALAIPSAGTAPILDSCPTQLKGGATGLNGDQFSAGFYILPGDHIDILIDTGNGGVRFAFQDVPVLRVGTSGSTGAPSVYVVEVARNQAELLTHLMTERAAPSCSKVSAFALKYVLRPQSEWGKMAADGSTYTPNYEDNTKGPAFGSGADTTVTPGALDQLFGH